MALLAELTVPTDAFALYEAVDAASPIALELERVVPTTESMVEYLWVCAGDNGDFEDALLEDPSVEAVETVSIADENRLYRVEWAATSTPLFERLASGDETLVRGDLAMESDVWRLTFRFDSREALEDFRRYCRRRDVDFRLVRLVDDSIPNSNGYAVSPKQREAMIVAHRKGYFAIPRETTLASVADALDISTRAASERLRRGQYSLIANTLLMGATPEAGGDDGPSSS